MKIGTIFLIPFILSGPLCADARNEKVFTSIYEKGKWGCDSSGRGSSGYGSTYTNCVAYIEFLEQFMTMNQIRSVVDVGCGDWSFSKYISWRDIKYEGVDVVKNVIERNVAEFSKDNISFRHADVLEVELEPADLLLCKDVLQHFTTRDIFTFLKKIKNFKHCLITNNIDLSGGENNKDILRGDFRPLDLTQPPFNVFGVKLFTYATDHCVKQVLYIRGSNIPE